MEESLLTSLFIFCLITIRLNEENWGRHHAKYIFIEKASKTLALWVLLETVVKCLDSKSPNESIYSL